MAARQLFLGSSASEAIVTVHAERSSQNKQRSASRKGARWEPMNTIEERYLCEAGYDRASWRAGINVEQRRVSVSCLMCLIVFVGSVCAAILSMHKGDVAEETTVQLERILSRLDKLQTITPKAAQALGQIVGQPQYQCGRMDCDARLKERNRAARAHLATLLESKTLAEEIDIALSGRPAGLATIQKQR